MPVLVNRSTDSVLQANNATVQGNAVLETVDKMAVLIFPSC